MSVEAQTNQDAALINDDAGQSEVSHEALQDDESFLDQDSGDQQDQQEEESDEIDVDGKKFALPKSAAEKLKAERMMHSDYTQKTQTVAEERRQVAAEREQVHKRHQESQQYITEVARVVAIDEQLAEYNKVDWQGLIDQAPTEAMKYQQQMRVLEGKRNDAITALNQKRQQNALSEQQEIAKQKQEAEAYFAREIKGWSAARSDELMKYGVAEGIPGSGITQAVLKHPALAKILNKAALYDQIAKKQAPAGDPPPQAKPAAKVGGNASVKKDPSRMTDAEFDAYRRRISSNRRK